MEGQQVTKLHNAFAVDSSIPTSLRDLNLDEARLSQDTLAEPLESIWCNAL